MYCKDCKFYEDRFCFYEPSKSFRLWGDEKACDNFIVSDDKKIEDPRQLRIDFENEANKNLNDWTKLKLNENGGVSF